MTSSSLKGRLWVFDSSHCLASSGVTIIRMRRGEGVATRGAGVTDLVKAEGKELMSFLHSGKDLGPVRPGKDFTREAGGAGFAICKCGGGAEQVVQVWRDLRQLGRRRLWSGDLRDSAPADLSGPLLVGRALARDRAGIYLRNFRRCGELGSPVPHRGFIDADVPGNGVIAHAGSTGVQQGGLHRPLLVLVGAPQPVGLIGAEAVPLRVFERALAQFAIDRVEARSEGGFQPVEAIGEPVVLTVMEDHYRRELPACRHRLGIVIDDRKVESRPR